MEAVSAVFPSGTLGRITDHVIGPAAIADLSVAFLAKGPVAERPRCE